LEGRRERKKMREGRGRGGEGRGGEQGEGKGQRTTSAGL
jgi:hypothetical protein